MDVLRYYFAALAQLVGIGGILAGGGWAWLGVAQLPLFAAADSLLGDDLRTRDVRVSDAVMDIPVVISSILGPLTLVALAWKVGQGGTSAGALIGMIASGAWLALVPVVPAVHELYHKRTPWKYALGTYLQFPYMDCTRSVAHMMSHHIHVGTRRDADTAQRGESMYSFIVRTIPGNYSELYQIEKATAAKRGLSVWSWQGKFTKAVLAYVSFLVVLLLAGGVAGMAAGFVSSFIARLWVEAFNYLQHCGLIRAEGEPVAPAPRVESSVADRPRGRLRDHQPLRASPRRLRALLQDASRRGWPAHAERIPLLPGRARTGAVEPADPLAAPASLGCSFRVARGARARQASEPQGRLARLAVGVDFISVARPGHTIGARGA